MDTRDRILMAVFGCCLLDLDHLADLWDDYAVDIDPDAKSLACAGGIYPALMAETLRDIAERFLAAHGLPKDEPRDEVNNFLASRVVFHDPEILRLFETWRP
jgi:hypothetical protein